MMITKEMNHQRALDIFNCNIDEPLSYSELVESWEAIVKYNLQDQCDPSLLEDL